MSYRYVVTLLIGTSVLIQAMDRPDRLSDDRLLCAALELVDAAHKGDHERVALKLEDNTLVCSMDNAQLWLLYLTIERGDRAVAQSVLDKCMVQDWLLLHYAAQYGHKNVVQLLLDKGIPVDAPDSNGWTPLYLASRGGHLDIVRLLLGRKARVNLADKYKLTPLHCAASNGHILVVYVLLESGADISLVDDIYGDTPLSRLDRDVALHEDRHEVIRQILIEQQGRSS